MLHVRVGDMVYRIHEEEVTFSDLRIKDTVNGLLEYWMEIHEGEEIRQVYLGTAHDTARKTYEELVSKIFEGVTVLS